MTIARTTFAAPDWAAGLFGTPRFESGPSRAEARDETRASKQTFATDDPRLERLLTGGLPDAAGVAVTPETALSVAAVWRAVSIISSTIAKLPLLLYKRVEQESGLVGRELLHATALARMLRDRPNREMSASDFWACMMAHALQWGNGIAEIERDRQFRPVALWPIHSSRVEITRIDGRLRYRVHHEAGEHPGGQRGSVVLAPDDVLHIKGMSFNGVAGLSVLQYARQSLGLTIAAHTYGARFFGNSGRPSGVLEHPARLGPEAAEHLRQSWRDNYGGSESGGTAVLEEGMKYHQIGMPPEDAQFIETRGLQIAEVARWYGVPVHKLMLLDKATFSNIEHQGAEFREDTIQPWARKIEQEINYKLLSGRETGKQYARFDMDDLVVPSLKERAEAYFLLRQGGFINGDEGRSREGWSPLPGGAGQPYWMPVNLAVVGEDGLPILPSSAANGSGPPTPGGEQGPTDPPDTPELPEIDPSDEGDENRVRSALRPVFEDVFERAQARERRAIAAKRAPERAAWLPGWTDKHRGWVAEQLVPAFRAALAARGADDRGDAGELAARAAETWCGRLTQDPRPDDALERAVVGAMQAAEVNT